jgi:hypothetical protein
MLCLHAMLYSFLQVKDRLQQVWASWRKLNPQQQRAWADKQLGKLPWQECTFC